MEKFEYIITAIFSDNHDYTGYSSSDEVMHDYMSYCGNEMIESSNMSYSARGHYMVGKVNRVEFAVNNLDLLQSSIDSFSNFSFADLYADVEIVQRNIYTGEIVPLLYVHIMGKR